MKSLAVHYRNKYPGGHVEQSENSLRAYDAEGKLRVRLEKGGDGMMHDMSEADGLDDRHCLAPIPKDSRIHKVRDGKISRDELADERENLKEEFVDESGRVQSCEELKKQGYEFCPAQKVTRRPEANAADESEESEVEGADAPAPKKKIGLEEKS